MDISLEENIVILDEAHNIEDISRDSGSFEIKMSQIEDLDFQLAKIRDSEFMVEEHSTLLLLIQPLKEFIHASNYNLQEMDKRVKMFVFFF